MTPTECIASLDAALVAAGEPVVISRTVAGVPQSVTCQAFVRAFRLDQIEMVGGVYQDDLLVTLSPSAITNAGWPGQVFSGSGEDPSRPRKGDAITVRGRRRNIEVVDTLAIQGVAVRFDMKATG